MQNPLIQKKINPLISLMRQPKIYVRLPSQGQYWAEGSIITTETSEYPVYSMTAKDELMLKTPDALLNGQAVVNVIQSCIPNITNAWAAPSLDLDALLIAIRLATYGESMETTITVAKEEATYTVDLRSLLDQLYSTVTWEERIEVNDSMIIYVKPLSYKELSKTSVETFETQRIMNIVNDDTMEEEKKLELFKTSFNKLTQVTLGIISDSIYKIDTVEGSVTDADFIAEFINNCDRDIFNSVQEHLNMLKERNAIKPMKVQATPEMIAVGVSSEIEVPIIFDASTFFV